MIRAGRMPMLFLYHPVNNELNPTALHCKVIPTQEVELQAPLLIIICPNNDSIEFLPVTTSNKNID
jgi:hypothetical protein